MAWCELLVLAMMLVIALDVFTRTAFNFTWQMSEEIAGYLLVALVFSSLPVSVSGGTLLRVDFLYLRRTARTRRMLDMTFSLLALAFCAIWTWQLGRLVWSSFHRETTSNGVFAVPLWVPQFIMPLGGLALLLALVAYLRGLWRSDADPAAPAGGEEASS